MSITHNISSQSDITATLLTKNSNDWRTLDTYNLVINHQLYHCLIYTWLALGWSKAKGQRKTQKYYLYIEFRDINGSSQYHTRTFRTLAEAITFQQQDACLLPLPFISPKQTALSPIGLTLYSRSNNKLQ
jgi:hypothetical protein